MDIKRIATAIDNLHTLAEERLDEVMAVKFGIGDFAQQLRRQAIGKGNCLRLQ